MSTDRHDPARIEATALRLSVAAGLALAVLGVGWGLLARSQVILFDGVYSIVGLALSWFGLRAAALVERGPTPAYPFGREALAPLVVGAQGLILAGTFGYAVIEAIAVMLAGGSQAQLGSALAYAMVTLAASLVMAAVLGRHADQSDLVAAELAQWRADNVLGVAMAAGFGLAVLLTRTAWADLAPYVDPALVLVAAALIMPTPLRMLRQAFRELLEGAPDPAVTGPIHEAVQAVRSTFGLPEPEVRIGKLGRKVYLELDFLVDPAGGWTVDDADRVRRALVDQLSRPGRLLWVNVELHTDPDWDT